MDSEPNTSPSLPVVDAGEISTGSDGEYTAAELNESSRRAADASEMTDNTNTGSAGINDDTPPANPPAQGTGQFGGQEPGKHLAAEQAGSIGASSAAGAHNSGLVQQQPSASSSTIKISSMINDTAGDGGPGLAHPQPLASSVSLTSTTPSSAGSAGSAQSMQLNDAFAYLDKVRAEFADQPEIYNKFLQVMREFKANSIDANGVIVRVVQLFKGHRNLILGFNAFLPKTHHIDPNIQDFSRWAQNLPGSHNVPAGSGPGAAAGAGGSSYAGPAPSQATGAGAGTGPGPSPGPGQPSSQPASSYHGASSAAPAGGPNAAPTIPAVGPSPAVVRGDNSPQFRRAVSFVEKIKQRFASEPEVYRTFLGILHSFHRDQKGVKEVYSHVQQLFRNESDLLEEFAQFLPDAGGAAGVPRATQFPPVGRFAHAGGAPGGAPGQKRAGATGPAAGPVGGAEKAKRARALDPWAGGVTRTEEEAEFFARVKQYLTSRQVYAEFLKCLSLFSQDILKLPELIGMVRNFIGGSEELFTWFKRYLNYQEPGAGAGAGDGERPGGGQRAPELNLSALKRIGCYRMYPRGYQLCAASGRTLLCDEVLNDDFVSCPSFESEDAGFLHSKKNQYEEALFKCEDERFELDMILEYNRATIAVLEPLARRLELLGPGEREALRLNNRLNGTSETIYKRAIRRIYGDAKGDDIYDHLQRAPAAAVPVVLRRLKQKDEEWRRVQRDWNRVWADIHIKNYYKALDHQGIDFKQADRKSLTLRALLHEIHTVKEEQRRQRQHLHQHLHQHTALLPAQLATSSTDPGPMQDLLRLVHVAIRTSPSFSGSDRKSLTRFFSTFVPDFFRIELTPEMLEGVDALGLPVRKDDDASEGDKGDKDKDKGDKDKDKADKVHAHAHAHTHAHTHESALLYANDVLFGFVRLFMIALERLERMKAAAVASRNQPFFTEKTNVVAHFLDLHSRQPVMTVDDELGAGHGDFYAVLRHLLAQLVEGDIEPGLFEEKVRYMFGTSGYLVFTYDRLLLALLRQCLCVLSDPACENLIRLYDSWRARTEAGAGGAGGASGTGGTSTSTSTSTPTSTSTSTRTSEYSVRLAAENIVFDGSSSTVPASPPSGLYRIEFSVAPGTKRRALSINLLDRLPVSVATSAAANASSSIEERWSLYVDNFVRLEANPQHLSAHDAVPVFLRRTRQPCAAPVVQYNLECKICINTYKLFYVEHTEDFLCRSPRPVRPLPRADAAARLAAALRLAPVSQ